MDRKNTRIITVGGIAIGGGNPIVIQSMLNTPSGDILAGVAQTSALKEAGCRIVRLAIPDMGAIPVIAGIKSEVQIPLVADIHFDYRLALAAVEAGVDKIRINPGNIGDSDRVKKVADACRLAGVPIRIGVNAGSLEKEILAKHGHPTATGMVDSALFHIGLLERFDFENIIVSLKSSDVKMTMDAYRLASESFDYPLHLGVTEAGTERMGLIKSSIGIGSLLADGIGDTIRVTLTADPVAEIAAARDILKAVGMPGFGPVVISCPTCGRTKIDVIGLAHEVEKRLEGCKKDIKVAVMGCAVNGPGEAREADIGIAGGDGKGLLFKKGVIVSSLPEKELLEALMKNIEEL